MQIAQRSRRFGYVNWRKQQDETMHALLGKRQTVAVVFGEFLLGDKRIDWQNRRISLGYKFTRTLDDNCTVFRLSMRKDDRLSVQCV